LLPLVVVACTEQQPVAPDLTPSLNMNGAIVVKEMQHRNPVRITWMDSEDAWDVLLLGFEPADHAACNGGEFVGGIPVREHIVVTEPALDFDLGDNATWNNGEGLHDLVTTIGRPPLYLYLRSELPPPGSTDEDWCTFYKEGYIAAGAWSATLYLDNDVSWLDDTPGMNVYGGTEAGVLWGTDGTKYKYEWKWKAQWFPEKGVDRLVMSVDRVVRIGK
jgi:hypothetical protein